MGAVSFHSKIHVPPQSLVSSSEGGRSLVTTAATFVVAFDGALGRLSKFQFERVWDLRSSGRESEPVGMLSTGGRHRVQPQGTCTRSWRIGHRVERDQFRSVDEYL
jgi:hypothetical protein